MCIRDRSLTWLLEAINTHLENGAEGEPWHLYQTTLFAMYVDYDNGQVRLSAMLACHDADMELPLKDFLEILRREARKESHPRHFSEANADTQIHRCRHPRFRRKKPEREPDNGFYS